MAVRGDWGGLRQAAAEERVQQKETLAQIHLERELCAGFERDVLQANTPPLPQIYDVVAIRKWDMNTMRQFMRKYGASRISARLHGIKEVTNPDTGRVYRFE